MVAKILPDGSRKRTKLFSGFLSHYFIHDRYGRPGKGNDKGAVEGLVGYARRNFMVPIPHFATWEAFNLWLEEQCRKRQADVLRGHSESIGQRLVRDLDAMMDLPASPFDACDQASGQVNSQSLVRYKTNDYSVPVAYGHPLPGSACLHAREGGRLDPGLCRSGCHWLWWRCDRPPPPVLGPGGYGL
ncbi:MAG: hypothetical protein ACJAZ1_002316 [Yoonia sp.]